MLFGVLNRCKLHSDGYITLFVASFCDSNIIFFWRIYFFVNYRFMYFFLMRTKSSIIKNNSSQITLKLELKV